jgi:hypothetical protein
MGRGCVLLVTLTSCNSILGLGPTQIAPDARLLLVPPDGTTTCGPPPDFNSWHYAPHAVGSLSVVLHPTFLTPDRIVFGYQGHLFESGVDGGAVEMTSLELYPGEGLAAPAAAPGGDLFWFWRLDGTGAGMYYATRDASGWHQQRADFGLIANQLQPGSVGFYGGTARMVVAVQLTKNSRGQLVEMSSADGVTWTRLDTLPFSDGSTSMYDPALSADGCFVLYSVYGNDTNDLYAAGRGADGVFLPPVHLDQAPNGFQPAIDPTLKRLWFNETGGPLTEATP